MCAETRYVYRVHSLVFRVCGKKTKKKPGKINEFKTVIFQAWKPKFNPKVLETLISFCRRLSKCSLLGWFKIVHEICRIKQMFILYKTVHKNNILIRPVFWQVLKWFYSYISYSLSHGNVMQSHGNVLDKMWKYELWVLLFRGTILNNKMRESHTLRLWLNELNFSCGFACNLCSVWD